MSAQETSLRWFDFCDVPYHPAGCSNHGDNGHGQQQYSGMLQCFSDAQLVLKGPTCARKISPTQLCNQQPELLVQDKEESML